MNSANSPSPEVFEAIHLWLPFRRVWVYFWGYAYICTVAVLPATIVLGRVVSGKRRAGE